MSLSSTKSLPTFGNLLHFELFNGIGYNFKDIIKIERFILMLKNIEFLDFCF